MYFLDYQTNPSPRQQPVVIGDADYRDENRELIEKVEQIRQDCAKANTNYVDPEFPSVNKESKEVQAQIIKWLRPKDIAVLPQDQHLEWVMFRGRVRDAREVYQGLLGDCWLIGCIGAIAKRSHIFYRIFATQELNKEGIYGFKLCIEGKWKDIIIDDQIPCDENNEMLYARARNRQLWLTLLEKAMAKVFGGYSRLFEYYAGVFGHKFLTGYPVRTYFPNKEIRSRSDLKAWIETLKQAFREDMGILASTDSQTESNYEELDLSCPHEHSVLGIARVRNTVLLLLRDVSGHLRWNGDWSLYSDKWHQVPANQMPSVGRGNFAGDGTFWISAEDVVRHFHMVQVCVMRQNYHEYFLKGKLFQVGDEHWDVFDIEVFEATQMDIHVQDIESNSKVTRCSPVSLYVFDKEDRLVGRTALGQLNILSLSSGVIPRGKYRVYVISLPKWRPRGFRSSIEVVQPPLKTGMIKIDSHALRDIDISIGGDAQSFHFTFACHSSRNVECSLVKLNPREISKVLMRLAVTIGEKRLSACAERPCSIHFLNTKDVGSMVVGVVNRHPTQAYILTTVVHTNFDKSYSTRSVETNTTRDIIPPSSSQIVQVLVQHLAFPEDGAKLDCVEEVADAEEVVDALSFQEPVLTRSNKFLHRTVPNSEIGPFYINDI